VSVGVSFTAGSYLEVSDTSLSQVKCSAARLGGVETSSTFVQSARLHITCVLLRTGMIDMEWIVKIMEQAAFTAMQVATHQARYTD
jgi:hypothetical protein